MRRRRMLTRRRRRAAGIAAAAVLALGLFSHQPPGVPAATGAPPAAMARVLGYARAQEGCPYVWGGTGPCEAGYDCSGLAMQAYASAGITIPRTSQAQWAAGPRVTRPQPGDLVFFAGGDGTPAAPGHVGIVTGSHLMIDAYATGFSIQQQSFGLASSWPGQQVVVGFTAPWEGP